MKNESASARRKELADFLQIIRRRRQPADFGFPSGSRRRTDGLRREEILFVSSNGFDIAGAKAHGFHVARIERLPASRLRGELAAAPQIGPALMFQALRMQPEQLGFQADATIAALTDLVSYVAGLRQA